MVGVVTMGVAAVLPPSMGSPRFDGGTREVGGRAVLWLGLSAVCREQDFACSPLPAICGC